MVIWLMLLIESLGEPFLQDCFRLGDGGYCADYRFTAFGKVVAVGAVIVPIMTLGIFVVGKIKGLEARDAEIEKQARRAAEGKQRAKKKI